MLEIDALHALERPLLLGRARGSRHYQETYDRLVDNQLRLTVSRLFVESHHDPDDVAVRDVRLMRHPRHEFEERLVDDDNQPVQGRIKEAVSLTSIGRELKVTAASYDWFSENLASRNRESLIPSPVQRAKRIGGIRDDLRFIASLEC
ncbi:hypothetical protein CN203_11575 [Sinorhizobium meliloti]|uniref:hypothetical protein n=1 Tax=Rhizobium meliloti TaxID=382 RepID=UPI000FDA71B1|nr:hypothetical protein [Sinorhizobium meliloti]RVH78128.1 hypothetical protein CN203_11575 [Sinorhizobium meliloti]